jgi:methyl-accepting chemotaxis protein
MWFSWFGIRSRIFGGMGVLVVLGLALAGMGIWQLTSIEGDVGRMSALSDNNTRVLHIVALLETTRAATLRYKVTGSPEALKDADAADAQIAELLAAAAAATLSDQRRQTYQSIAAAVVSYHALRGKLTELTQVLEASRAKLFSGGDQMSADTGQLVAITQKSEVVQNRTAARNVETAILLVRVANWRFLATTDPKGPATFRTNADAAAATLDQLEALPLADDVRQRIAPVRASLAAYGAAFDTVSDAMLKSADLFDNQIQPIILRQVEAAGSAAASLDHDFTAAQGAAVSQISGTIGMQKVVAGTAMVLGGLIAWLIGRGIVRPVSGMTAAMRRLAEGDTAVDVPSRDARDEMGAMAKAVDVFKQHAIERDRLAAERQAQEARAAQEKQAALAGMADKIETETGAALEAIAGRTADMAATAEKMSASASRTGESAGGASAAAAQALANVQTVASAAEQLAASIREIGGQVSQSTVVVGRAVQAGNETRGTMEALNEKVGRIGAVADMISEIAAKTNLLALNATIEAARAGDAGKGFAVVASEVKQLATQTARSTEEISRHIAEVRAATSASVASVGRIEQTIGEINAIAGSIAAAVEQQGAATAEIARNVTETAAAANEMSRRIHEVSGEAETTGQRSAKVRESASSLDTMVGDLKRTLVRVVRTSTAEVDRRHAPRYPVTLAGHVTGAGQSRRSVTVSDLSEGGAMIEGGGALAVGASGTLEMERIGMPLPFMVRATDKAGLHVEFQMDPPARSRFIELLDRVVVRKAA